MTLPLAMKVPTLEKGAETIHFHRVAANIDGAEECNVLLDWSVGHESHLFSGSR
ncbi:MAG: hypothetical protein M3Y56_04030 [Armatimonadota bacterium]|nr:hypothetical protein [Armatimonadota bacterium]